MAMSSTLLRTYVAQYPDHPEMVFQRVNECLFQYATASQFVTVFLGILDPQAGTLLYSNAGHNPPILLSSAQPELVRQLKQTGLPLGMVEEVRWQMQRVQLVAGDVLILYTDGITEAENVHHEFYELKRLIEVAGANRNSAALALRDTILTSVHEFAAGAPQVDDIALMVLRRE